MNKLTAPPLPAKGPLGRPMPKPIQPPALPPTPPTHDQIMDAIQKTHYLNDGLRLLLNKPGGPSRGDVIDETGHLISEGILSSQQAAQELQSLPDDPGQIKAWLQNHIMNSTATRGRLFDMLGGQGGQGGQGAQQPQTQAQPQPPMQNALTAGMPQNG